MNPGLIWGTILVVLGLSLLLKSIFNIAIPLVRPFIGCVLIYLGLHIMMDPFTESSDKKMIIFGQNVTQLHDGISTYNLICGSGELDFSALSIIEEEVPREITVNAIFGKQKIIIDPQVPTKVRINAMFSRAVMPDESLFSFGRNVYKTAEIADPILMVQVNVVFGSVDVALAKIETTSGAVSIDLVNNEALT